MKRISVAQWCEENQRVAKWCAENQRSLAMVWQGGFRVWQKYSSWKRRGTGWPAFFYWWNMSVVGCDFDDDIIQITIDLSVDYRNVKDIAG